MGASPVVGLKLCCCCCTEDDDVGRKAFSAADDDVGRNALPGDDVGLNALLAAVDEDDIGRNALAVAVASSYGSCVEAPRPSYMNAKSGSNSV